MSVFSAFVAIVLGSLPESAKWHITKLSTFGMRGDYCCLAALLIHFYELIKANITAFILVVMLFQTWPIIDLQMALFAFMRSYSPVIKPSRIQYNCNV